MRASSPKRSNASASPATWHEGHRMTAYVVGVDIGTQSTKALLCDSAGRIIAQHAKGYRPDTPRPLWAEQWPAVWLDAVIECIAGCVESARTRHAGFSPSAVRALCISSL